MPDITLISVVVLTYNSEKYIIETLDSIKNQDYPYLEIIISDDHSSDNTCKKVDEWLCENKSSFFNSLLIQSHKNRGTCANYNQGIVNSHGKYVKVIDGDDLLSTPESISDYYNFCVFKNCSICISDLNIFSDESVDLTKHEEYYSYFFECVRESLPMQKKRIVRNLEIADPGLFFSRSLFDKIGGFNENYKLLEEWPFFLDVIYKNSIKIEALDKKLVSYRINSSSISHSGKSFSQKLMTRDMLKFYFHERLILLIKQLDFRVSISCFVNYLYRYIYQRV